LQGKKYFNILKKYLLLVILTILSIVSFAQDFRWAKEIEGSRTTAPSSIAVDSLGNVYTVGTFMGAIDFDPGPGVYNLISDSPGVSNNAYSSAVFILKLDSSGNFIWAKQIGTAGIGASASCMTLDAHGNIYITGSFSNTVDFDPGAGTYYLTALHDYGDVFVLKLDSAANFIWAGRFGESGPNQQYGNAYSRSIKVDTLGNVYTTGSFLGIVDFDPGNGIYNLASALVSNPATTYDIFISKLNASGNFVWAKRVGGTESDFGEAITVDVSGNAYITGSFCSTVDFNPGAGTFYLTSGPYNYSWNIFVLKLNSSGNFVWAGSFTGLGANDFGRSIAVDKSGNVYTSGGFSDTVDFDPGPGTYYLTSNSKSSPFVSKLNSSGGFVWAKTFSDSIVNNSNTAYSAILSLDTVGNIYITGGYSSTVDFDPGPGTYNLTAIGTFNVYIVKLDPSGNFILAKNIGEGTNLSCGPRAIAIDASFNIYTTGNFDFFHDGFLYAGTADFDPGSAVYNLTADYGLRASFIVKLAPCFPQSTSPITGPLHLCIGATKTYSINSIPNTVGYTWTVPVGAVIDSGQNTNSITVTFASNSGKITVIPYNTCGPGLTKSLDVNVYALPIAGFVANNASHTFPIKGCTPLNIDIIDSSHNADSVWYILKDTTGTHFQFSIFNFQLADTGWFDITQYASRKAGCMDSLTMSHAVYVSPKPTIQVLKDTTYQTCLQNNLRLKINSSYNDSIIITWGDGNTDHRTGIFNGNGTDTITHYYTNPGNYTIIISSGNRYCAEVGVITHLVRPPLQMTASNDTTICKGAGTGLWASATGADSVFTYILKTPAAIVQNNSGLFWVLPDSTATYTIGAINPCAIDTLWKQITVTLEPPLVLQLNTRDTTVCIGSIVTINATATGGNGNYNYILKKNNSIQQSNTTGSFNITVDSNGIYNVVVTDNCTVINDSVTCDIKIFNTLKFTNISPDIYLCEGETTTLKANINKGWGSVNYLWYDASGNTLATTDTLQITPTISTQIILKVTDACISIYDTMWVYEFATTSSTQLLTDVSSGCVPLTVNFETPTLIYSNAQPCEANWDFGDGNSLMQNFNNSNSTLKAKHTYIAAGIYQVNVEVKFKNNVLECNTFTATVEALTIPQIKLSIAPKKITLPKNQCTATIATANSDSVVIDWGDGYSLSLNLNLNLFTQTHDYIDTGHYIVKATAYNKNTCYTEAKAIVYHADTFICYIPNAFTPNRDATNETFKPVVSFCKSYELTIYNRWGEIVYETNYKSGNAPQPAWSGEGSPADTYIYIFTATDGDNVNYSYKGTVMLIR
jgi:gliding motility-associated-like protein